MLQNEVSHRCVCVKPGAKGGIPPFWGSANLAENVSRDMGYRSDSIATSRRRKGANKMGGRGVANKGGKKEERMRENRSEPKVGIVFFPYNPPPPIPTNPDAAHARELAKCPIRSISVPNPFLCTRTLWRGPP